MLLFQPIAARLGRMMQRPGRLILILGCFSAAQACNVPVFRYALEKWPADPYTLVLYQKAGTESNAAIEQWLREHLSAGTPINVQLQTVAVDSDARVTAAAESITGLPWLEVYLPHRTAESRPIWSGLATAENIHGVLHSPLRSLLAEKLLQGDALVWLLLASGNDSLDAQACNRLQAALERAQRELTIPDTGVDSHGNPIPVTEFKHLPVRFSFLEMDRQGADEAFLRHCLLQVEPDLSFFDEPMAFPVLGQGRVLYALIGPGINENNVLESCRSAIGWCSCEVKELNPGLDLLLAADWSRPSMGRLLTDAPSPIVGLTAFVPDSAQTADAPMSSPVETTPAERSKEVDALPLTEPDSADQTIARPSSAPPSLLFRNLTILAITALTVLLVASMLLMKRKRGLF